MFLRKEGFIGSVPVSGGVDYSKLVLSYISMNVISKPMLLRYMTSFYEGNGYGVNHLSVLQIMARTVHPRRSNYAERDRRT
jgi:hypothetical protein